MIRKSPQATRDPLPGRRINATETVDFRGSALHVTVGFDEALKPREVFATGPKEGSDMQHVLSDACVLVSVALQCGVTPDALSKSLGLVPALIDGEMREAPASPIGAIMAVVREARG